ncbi:G-protein coupled receptor 183-B [Engraulis encrasicolus]|uniref:G-protein coupled receptor 183-B n=1 Tax=Engraulis encrasicolus TaxID=184585 RepID=UPI002FD3B1E9
MLEAVGNDSSTDDVMAAMAAMAAVAGGDVTDGDGGANCTGLYDHRSVARVLMPVHYAVVFALGLLGNSLALHVIWTSRVKMNATTTYSANLAASDVLFALSLPLRGLYYGMGFHWPLGEVACKVTGLLFYINTYAGVNFMTCLALDRMVAVVGPRHLVKLRQVGTVRWICLGVWLLVGGQTLPLLTMQMTRQEADGHISCMEYPSLEAAAGASLPYTLIGAVSLGYVVPTVTILVCYSVLWRKLRSVTRGNQLSERSGRGQKAMGVTAAVVLVFLVCFTPYHLDILQYMIRKLIYQPGCDQLRSFQVSLHVTVCLMNLNSCLDPFVYFFACQGYKRKIMTVLKRNVFSKSIYSSPESSNSLQNRDSRYSVRVRLNSAKGKEESS